MALQPWKTSPQQSKECNYQTAITLLREQIPSSGAAARGKALWLEMLGQGQEGPALSHPCSVTPFGGRFVKDYELV